MAVGGLVAVAVAVAGSGGKRVGVAVDGIIATTVGVSVNGIGVTAAVAITVGSPGEHPPSRQIDTMTNTPISSEK